MKETPPALVHFVCSAHARGPDAGYTIHSGQWAFCPLDVRASDHDWQSIPPTSYDELLIKYGANQETRPAH